MDYINISDVEKILGYNFKNKIYLKTALTHKSFAFEKYHEIMIKNYEPDKYNERLEFLGDAVLELIITQYLYDNTSLNEGVMTKKRAAIVCEETLSAVILETGIYNYIFLGKCERKNTHKFKKAIYADAFESILGAIYLDSGMDSAKKISLKLLMPKIKEILSDKSKMLDYKSKLQEVYQIEKNAKIDYKMVEATGPDHDRTFRVELYLNDKKKAEGVGSNIKAAEKEAAKKAYFEILKNNKKEK